MTQQVKVAGAWKTAVPRVKVAGSWKTVKGGWVKVAGVWRRFHDQGLDTQVVTSGVSGVAPNRAFGWANFGTPFGSISDGISDITGTAIKGMYWSEGANQLMFAVSGLWANAGWTTMTIAGMYGVNRASAQYLQNAGDTYWSWNGVANPYAVNRVVTWT
jgi:hypothetical protein